MTNLTAVPTADLIDELHARFESEYVVSGAVVMEIVSEKSGVSIHSLQGTSRKQRLSNIRMMAMYLVYKICPLSLSEVTSLFHKGHHTTVLHAIKRTPEILKESSYAHLMHSICIALADSPRVSKTSVNQALLDLNFLKSPDS